MKYFVAFILMGICFKSNSQSSTVDVVENTLKISGLSEEVFYYGFAEGDQVVFSFEELNGKELKEVEIVEYPASSKFMDYKTKKIENKTLNVLRTGVYMFRFSNSAITGRICKIKIQRIPSSDKTKFFNTSIKWINKPDTTWNVYTKDVVIGYDTLLVPKTKKELIATELYEELILEKNERVNSTMNSNGNKSAVFFTLPASISNELNSQKVIGWAYWVGVGEEANDAWKQNAQIVTSIVKGTASYMMSPLGGLLAGKVTELLLPKTGEDVSYAVVDEQNKSLFMQGAAYEGYDFGRGIAGYKKFTNRNMLSGTWHIVLSNDNVVTGINTNVKVIALIEKNKFEYRSYTEQKVTARYAKQIMRDPVVKVNKVPVIIN